MGFQFINCLFQYIKKLKNKIWKLTISKLVYNYEHLANNIIYFLLHKLNKYQKK